MSITKYDGDAPPQEELEVCHESIATHINYESLAFNSFEVSIEQHRLCFAVERVYEHTGETQKTRSHVISSCNCCPYIRCDREAEIYVNHPLTFPRQDFFDIVQKRGALPENSCMRYFMQALIALHCLHLHGIYHRDICLENFQYDESQDAIILHGLDLITRLQADQSFTVIYGRENYCPPEVFQYIDSEEEYEPRWVDGVRHDTWSLVIMLYIMSTGHPPFQAASEQYQAFNLVVQEQKLDDVLNTWEFVLSEGVVELMQSVLQTDPERRPTLNDIAHHPWLQPVYYLWEEYLSELSRRANYSRRRAFLMFLACGRYLDKLPPPIVAHRGPLQGRDAVFCIVDLVTLISAYL